MQTRAKAAKKAAKDADVVPETGSDAEAVDENAAESIVPSGEEKTLVQKVVEEEAAGKVLPRLRTQRGTPPTKSTSKSSLDVIRAELTALKRPQVPQPKAPPPAAVQRQGTPQKTLIQKRPNVETSTSPKKAALPLKYSQLLEMFKHLQMVYRIRKTKSVFLTFADAKVSIQKATKKTFSIKHLAKIKYMIPDILQWQYMEGNGETVASARLIISLETQLGTDRGGMDDAAMYALLRERLSQRARRAALIGKDGEEIPEAELPDPSLSVLVSASKALSGRSWSNASSGYRSKSPASVKTRRKTQSITPAKRLETSPTFLSPKRLTTVTEASHEVVGETSASSFKTPKTTPQPSILSPCSNNRDVIRENFKRRMLMSPSKVKERARSQAMGNLVTALNDVRAVFRRFRTTKRLLKDVLQAMRANTKSKYTEEAAQLHLHLLLEYAPQFVKLETGERGEEVVTIDMECNISAIKEMLKEVADNRPKIEVADAAVERRMTDLDILDL